MAARPMIVGRVVTATIALTCVLIVYDGLANLRLIDVIRVIIWLEVLSVTVWTGLAAHRTGLRGRSLAMAVVAGLFIGGIVLALLVALEPGKVGQIGTAAATAQLN